MISAVPPIPAMLIVSAMVAHQHPWMMLGIEEARSIEDRTNGLFRLGYCSHGTTAADTIHSLTHCSASVPWHNQLVHGMGGGSSSIDSTTDISETANIEDEILQTIEILRAEVKSFSELSETEIALFMTEEMEKQSGISPSGDSPSSIAATTKKTTPAATASLTTLEVTSGPIKFPSPAPFNAYAAIARMLLPRNTSRPGEAYLRSARMYARACDAWAVLRSRAPIGGAPSGFNTVATLVCDLLEAGHITSASDAFSFSADDADQKSSSPSDSFGGPSSQKDAKGASRNSVTSSDDDSYSPRTSRLAEGESASFTGK